MSTSLDDLLAEASSVGRVESTGTFQIDLDRAIEKMRSHQAENPYHYVNHILRAGFLSGARQVQVTSDGKRTRVEFHGAALPAERLGHLLEDLFQNHGSSSHELATAANLAFGLSGNAVEIKIDDGQQSQVLVRRADGKSDLYQVSSQGRPHTTFQLSRATLSTLGSFGVNSPEYLSIVRRFRLAPFEIRVNKDSPPRGHGWGRRRERGFDSREGIRLKEGVFSLGQMVCRHQHVAEVRLFDAPTQTNGVGLRASTAKSSVRVGCDSLEKDELERCSLAIGLRADPSLESVANWVYCGETIQVFPVKLPLTGVEVAIDASDLQLDATGERLVQNSAFVARWEKVKEEFGYLHSALRAAYPGKNGRALSSALFFDSQALWTKEYLQQRGTQEG